MYGDEISKDITQVQDESFDFNRKFIMFQANLDEEERKKRRRSSLALLTMEFPGYIHLIQRAMRQKHVQKDASTRARKPGKEATTL